MVDGIRYTTRCIRSHSHVIQKRNQSLLKRKLFLTFNYMFTSPSHNLQCGQQPYTVSIRNISERVRCSCCPPCHCLQRANGVFGILLC